MPATSVADTPTPTPLARATYRRLARTRDETIRRLVRLVGDGRLGSVPVEQVVQLVLAGQRAIVLGTDAALSYSAGVATGTSTAPLGLDPEQLIGRRARPPMVDRAARTRIGRANPSPAVRMWGPPLEQIYSAVWQTLETSGVDAAQSHLEQLVRLDLQMAHREAAHAHMQADKRVVGWRRQVNPSAGGTCGLCLVASTRVYRRINKLQIHRGCNCSVHAVYDAQLSDAERDAVADQWGANTFRGERPGAVFDHDRLELAYQQAGLTDHGQVGKLTFTADDLPAGRFDDDAVQALLALDVSEGFDPSLGATLLGNRHDTRFEAA